MQDTCGHCLRDSQDVGKKKKSCVATQTKQHAINKKDPSLGGGGGLGRAKSAHHQCISQDHGE